MKEYGYMISIALGTFIATCWIFNWQLKEVVLELKEINLTLKHETTPSNQISTTTP